MNREINASNAFVAAWLPGSEGAGIADVLYRKNDGSVAHDFNGRLSFSWPRTVLHDPVKSGKPGYNPLFPLGYGLRYTDNGNLPPLSEEPGADINSSQAGIFFATGTLAPPWMLSWSGENGGTQPLSTVPSTVAGGRVRVSRIDRDAQEDSLRFQWLGQKVGQAAAGVQLDSREPFDFSRETNGDVMLVLTLRVNQAPTAPVDLAMACGERCAGTVPIGPTLSRVPASSWQRLGVPLKCFGASGADMKQIRTAFSLRTSGTLDIAIHRAALATEADQKVACTI
jgi:beta-glucosidase